LLVVPLISLISFVRYNPIFSHFPSFLLFLSISGQFDE